MFPYADGYYNDASDYFEETVDSMRRRSLHLSTQSENEKFLLGLRQSVWSDDSEITGDIWSPYSNPAPIRAV